MTDFLCWDRRHGPCATQCQACQTREAVCDDSVVESVVADLRARSRVGVLKYGCTLDRGDLTRAQWVRHLQEELLDAVLYATVLLREMGGGK